MLRPCGSLENGEFRSEDQRRRRISVGSCGIPNLLRQEARRGWRRRWINLALRWPVGAWEFRWWLMSEQCSNQEESV